MSVSFYKRRDRFRNVTSPITKGNQVFSENSSLAIFVRVAGEVETVLLCFYILGGTC